MKIIYTETGKQALEAFKEAKVKELEENIKSRKYVFGDEEVEITAFDVKEAQESRDPAFRYMPRRLTSTKFFLQIYIVFGVLIMFAGLFYDRFYILLRERPEQLVMVIAGAVLAVVGGLFLARIRAREREEEQISRIERSRNA